MPIEHAYRDRWQTSIRELWDQDRAGRSTETFDRLLAVLEERDRDLEEHLRATTSTTDWIEPTLTNSWTNWGSTLQTAEYQRVGERVYIRGVIAGGTSGAAAFTLRPTFRPPVGIGPRAILCDPNVVARLDVSAAGAVTVTIPAGGTNAYASIDCDFSVVAR